MNKWFFELWHYRELLIALTFREIKVRYKQTLLGVAWAILQPASLTVIFTIVFSLFLQVDVGDIPYPVFAYSALVPWIFFSNSLSFGSLSVVNNGNLVTKVYFPREILPLASIGAAFFDFCMAMIVFVFLLFFYQITPTLNIIYLPFIILPVFFITAGLAFMLSAINVLFRDIKFIIPLLLQIWLYLTPIIYSSESVPEKFKPFMILNPMFKLIENFRNVTVYGRSIILSELVLQIIISLFIFLIGYWFFKAKEKIFADVM